MSSRAVEWRPSVDDAQDCWDVGVQPLIDAYGPAAAHLVHAVVFAHRDRFPTPVFITGSARAGGSDLLQAVSELTGDWPILQRKTTTLPALRRAATRGLPLLVEEAARAGADDASMFQLIHDEFHDPGTPLEEPSILVATGSRRIAEHLRRDVLQIPLPTPGAGRALRAAATSATAASARRVVQIYLQQNAPRRALPATARRSLVIASSADEPASVRCDAALEVGAALTTALELAPLRIVHEPVLEALSTAVREALTAGVGAGRLRDGSLYAVPEVVLPRVRAIANDPSITAADVVSAVDRARLRATGPAKRSGQGNTVPTRTDSGLRRAWRLRSTLIS